MKLKRKLIQWAVFGLYNADVMNFANGTINKGPQKSICVPGLNCYSCPGAIGSCPIGALQAVIGARNFSFSFYVMGLLLAFGVLLGRFVCGFLCPFGLFQELLHKIPFPRFKLWKWTRFIKYAVLAVFVLAMPMFLTNYIGMGMPAFCQYICPAGTLEGGIPLLSLNPELRQTIGPLFSLKATILALTILGCLFFYRFFCRVLCPLGAIYSLFNRISLYRIELNSSACNNCGTCKKACRMDITPSKTPNHAECIRCSDCVNSCPASALKTCWGIKGGEAGVGDKATGRG